MRVPTGLVTTDFLAVLWVVDQVDEDIGGILVRSKARLGWSLFWFQVGTDLLIVLVFDFGLPGIVHISIYIGRVKASVIHIVILSMVRISWPDLLDVWLARFGDLLLTSGWRGHYLLGSFLLPTRDKVLAVGAHSESVFLWCRINNIVLHRAG